MSARKNLGSGAFWGATNHGICDLLGVMDAASTALAQENAALKGGTGGRPREGVGRHGADRRAKAANRQAGASNLRSAVGALGAADRSIGACVRRAGSQRDGRRTGGGASRRQDDNGRRLHAQATRARHVPRASAARARGDRAADGLRLLRRRAFAQARRRRDADAGDDAASVEGHRDRAGEVLLPGLREDHASAGAIPCHCEGMGGAEPAGDDRVREVWPAPASESPGRALCPRTRSDRAVDHGRRGRFRLRGARSAATPYRGACHGCRTPARR